MEPVATFRKMCIRYSALLMLLFALPPALPAEPGQPLLLTNCTIHRMGSNEVLHSGYVELTSNRITGLGRVQDLTEDRAGQRINLHGAHLLPAFTELHVTVTDHQAGLWKDAGPTLLPEFLFTSETTRALLRQGITTVMLRHPGYRVVAGYCPVVQVRPDSGGGAYLVGDSLDYQIALTMPAGTTDTTPRVYDRLSRYYAFREGVASGQIFGQDRSAHHRTGGSPDQVPRWYLQIYDLYDVERIRQILDVRDPFLTFSGPAAPSVHGETLPSRGLIGDAFFVVNPVLLHMPGPLESRGSFLSLLEEYDLQYALSAFRGLDEHPGLLSYARRLRSAGVSAEKSLETITVNPGTYLRPVMNTGRIERGSRANLVVMTGPPMQVTSEIILTITDGQPVWISD